MIKADAARIILVESRKYPFRINSYGIENRLPGVVDLHRCIEQTWNTNFGTTKIIFDSSMTVIAGVLSIVFFGKLNGVREGTIIAALLVGFIARLFEKNLEFVQLFFPLKMLWL